MEFIGTEVGIKIRSAIKAKLTELGKTVDDELIDYIMVMVANKKEENQMARDLQPFLESDTVKFTAWLHKVLQKLEQVTIIVTDEEYKIASSAFGKLGKKRKSTDSTGKKKIGSKEEPKEKKKKIKHEKHKISKSNAVSKIQVEKQAKLKHTHIVTQQATSSAKLGKIKKMRVVHVDSAEVCRKNPAADVRQKLQRGPVAKKRAIVPEDPTEPEVQVTKVDTSSTVQQTTENTIKSSPIVVRSIVPVQRPVMMVSDDDDDDDDFINIKTDMAEEDELLDEEKNQRALALSSPQNQREEQDTEASTSPSIKFRTVVVDTSKADTSNILQAPMPVVRAETVRQALVAPRSVVATTNALPPTKRVLVRTATASHQKTASSTRSSVIVSSVRSSVTMPQRPSILSRVGAVLKRKASTLSDEEGEDEDAKNGSVASVVKVKPRPKVPAGSQAPKNLLLRAMADAHRSLASAPPREAQAPVSNRSPLFTRKFRDRQQIEQHERIAITLPNVHDPSDPTLEGEEDDHVMEEQQIVTDEVYVPELVAAPSNLPADVVYSPSPIAKASSAKSNIDVSKTEFLVTLDGYKGFDAFDRDSHSEEKEDEETNELAEDEELVEIEESSEMVEIKPRRQKIVFDSEGDIRGVELESSKKLSIKSLDRCRFWPACRSGDACTFHHPTQTCKSFPNCSFGDRCLYIHPNCKFDATCTRKDCPFTHASPRNLAVLPIKPPVLVARPVPVAVQTCLFFPNCSNVNCRFYHPVPCRYGRLCSKPDCSFIHSDVPPKEKMKWINTER